MKWRENSLKEKPQSSEGIKYLKEPKSRSLPEYKRASNTNTLQHFPLNIDS